MTEDLAIESELRKLAKLLRLDSPADLAFVAAPAEELRAYREEVDALLREDAAEMTRRAAEAAKLLPPAMLVRLCKYAVPPVMAAHIAAYLPLPLIIDLGKRLDPVYVAKLAANLDGSIAISVLTALPSDFITQIAHLMAVADDHVAMGRFVVHLPDQVLCACLAELSDADLLRTAFVVEEPDRLDHVTSLLDDDRMARLPESAQRDHLHSEFSWLLIHLGDLQRRRIHRHIVSGG